MLNNATIIKLLNKIYISRFYYNAVCGLVILLGGLNISAFVFSSVFHNSVETVQLPTFITTLLQQMNDLIYVIT